MRWRVGRVVWRGRGSRWSCGACGLRHPYISRWAMQVLGRATGPELGQQVRAACAGPVLIAIACAQSYLGRPVPGEYDDRHRRSSFNRRGGEGWLIRDTQSCNSKLKWALWCVYRRAQVRGAPFLDLDNPSLVARLAPRRKLLVQTLMIPARAGGDYVRRRCRQPAAAIALAAGSLAAIVRRLG